MSRGRKASFKQLMLPLTERFLFLIIISELIISNRELVFKFFSSRLNLRPYTNLDKKLDD